MKTFFVEVDNAPRAGPIDAHVNNFMLRIFAHTDAQMVAVYSTLTSAKPIARYTRDGTEVIWYAPVKSRKQKPAKKPAVKQSARVGQWVRIGPIEYTDDTTPTKDAAGVCGVCKDEFLADLIEFPIELYS